jgi:hypothetical protein
MTVFLIKIGQKLRLLFMKTHVHLHFFTSDTVVALVIKVQDVPMAGYLCYRGYQGYCRYTKAPEVFRSVGIFYPVVCVRPRV